MNMCDESDIASFVEGKMPRSLWHVQMLLQVVKPNVGIFSGWYYEPGNWKAYEEYTSIK